MIVCILSVLILDLIWNVREIVNVANAFIVLGRLGVYAEVNAEIEIEKVFNFDNVGHYIFSLIRTYVNQS